MEANKKGLYALFAIFGVLCVGLGALGVYALSSKTSTQTPSPAQETQPAVNTTLDNVVAGSGALDRSTRPGFEGVGISYPATCIGAIQAGAEWSQQVFLNTQRLEKVSVSEVNAFLDTITLTPGLIKEPNGPDRGIVRVARMHADALYPRYKDGLKLMTIPQVNQGLAQLISCSIASKGTSSAVVRIYTLFDNVSVPTGFYPLEQGIGSRTYELREKDGLWKLSRMTEPMDAVAYPLPVVTFAECTPFLSSEERSRAIAQRPLGDAGRKIISDCAGGSGFHSFANAGGEWGKP